ncbi:MAG TPA: PAS domain S-box protein [Flavobacteriales bacterium]|nr:PAS domain S-box protein [Flavobacteriales bacterium]
MNYKKHQLEELLKQYEKRFQDFFENAPEGIAIYDVTTGKFIQCNSKASELLKFSHKELLQLGPKDLSPKYQPDGKCSDEKSAEFVARALAGEKMIFEWVALNGLGETFFCEVRLALIEQSESPLLYASFVDITDRKETEEQIRQQNMRLAEIAYIQSHMLRKPIASILGLINLFNFENPKSRHNVELMIKIKTASELSDNILKEIATKTTPFHKRKN